MRICKACGAENRDEAKFCRGCGSPLPQVKAPARDLKKEQEVKRFWSMFMAGVLAFIVIALLTKGKL
ncbi:MAG TPA: zinc-ribbon domain-containing protein, partial [Candidatus Goldiibacteriota bacterium]|nr:zinc-ribbon domain-containing protein [Candidatus Goldiibacteriota bacterium]